MRTCTFVFLAIAIVAGGLTFSGLSENVSNIAKGVYFVFMLLVAGSVLLEPEDLESIRPSSRPVDSLRSSGVEPARGVVRAQGGIEVR